MLFFQIADFFLPCAICGFIKIHDYGKPTQGFGKNTKAVCNFLGYLA